MCFRGCYSQNCQDHLIQIFIVVKFGGFIICYVIQVEYEQLMCTLIYLFVKKTVMCLCDTERIASGTYSVSLSSITYHRKLLYIEQINMYVCLCTYVRQNPKANPKILQIFSRTSFTIKISQLRRPSTCTVQRDN